MKKTDSSATKTSATVKKAVVPAKETSAPVKKAVKTSAKKAAPAPAAKAVKKAAPAPAAKAVKATAKKAAPAPVKAVKATAKKAAPAPAAKAVKATAKKTSVPVKKATKKTAVAEDAASHVHKKLKLTKAKQKHYISLLMEHRLAFMDQLRFHQDDALQAKKDSASERAGMATHMADLGTDNFRHDLELGLLSEEGDVIVMIDEALQRIQDSEYGICMDCGCELNEGRLEAKPYARYCTKCKSAREALEDPHRRHR